MTAVTDLAIGLLAGLVGGAAFFGGLRWTIRRLPSARRPVLLATASFVVRGVLLAGLLVAVSAGSPVRVVAGLGGVLAVRTVMVRDARRETGEEASTWT